jgi:putative sialic acid transporter
MDAIQPTPPPTPAWYRTITRRQWTTLAAAMMGWMLDAMDFTLYVMALTTLQGEFHFDKDIAGLLATVTLLTSAVGGLLFGFIADRIGRTRALMLTVLIFSVCSLGTATAQDLWQLILWRTALGLGMGGEWASGAVLVSETWPAEHRGKAIGIMQSGWAIGYILAALAAAVILPTLGWRWLFVIGALPALFVFWIRRAVPEPEMWAARNLPPTRSASEGSPLPARRTGDNPFAAIFGRALLYRTIMATLLATVVMFAYWGVFTWLPGFLASPVDKGGAGLNTVSVTAWIIPTQLGAFVGYLSFGFISDRLGRRLTFILYMLAAAVLVPFYGQMAAYPTVLLATGPLLGFVGHGYFSLFGSLLSELFPTQVRATGQGLTYNVGRGLGAFGPYSIGLLAKTPGVGIGLALALTSAFFLAGAVLILLVPETRGKQLE